MVAFENLDEEGYSKAVNYFHYVGGFNLKKAVSLCLKESLEDSFTLSLTWWGREENKQALYNARLMKAVYDAVCRSQHFEKPQRAEFQNQMRDALRTSKERHRHRQHKQRKINPTIQRNLWSNETENVHEIEEELQPTNE